MTADPPVACSLDAGGLDDRLGQWSALVARADGPAEPTSEGGRRLRFSSGAVDVAELAALAEAEVACCPFFTFSVGLDRRGVSLEVNGPPEAAEAVDALLLR